MESTQQRAARIAAAKRERETQRLVAVGVPREQAERAIAKLDAYRSEKHLATLIRRIIK